MCGGGRINKAINIRSRHTQGSNDVQAMYVNVTAVLVSVKGESKKQ